MHSLKKKVLLTTLICTLLINLTGCGGSNTNTGKSSSGKSEPIEITYLHINPEKSGGEMINAYAEEFNKKQDKYVVKPVFKESYTEIMQQLQADSAAGKPPSVIQVGYYWLHYFTDNYTFQDMKTIDASYLDSYLPNVIDIVSTKDGKVAGIPYSFSTPVMYYNVDMIKKAGLDPKNPPKTIDELYDWARAIKEKTGDYGLAYAASDFWLEQWQIESNGGRMLTYGADGKPQCTFASESGIQAMQKIADLINQDKAAAYITGNGIKDAFTGQKIAMMGGTIGWSSSLTKDASFEVMCAPLPTFGNETPRVPVGGNFLALTGANKETQEGGWEWIKFLTTKEGYVEWTNATGYVSPRKDVSEADGFKKLIEERPWLNASLDQMKYTVPFTSYPGKNGLKIEEKLLDTRDIIMNGEKPAQEALTACQEECNKLLAE